MSALIAENIMDRRGKEHAVAAPRSAATVHLQSLGRIRGPERCGAAIARSDLPPDCSEKIWDRGAALPSRLHWFETEVLSQAENLEGLGRINRELIAKAEAMDSPQRVVLDMDSTEIRFTENRNRVPTTGILNQPAITRCCCSTGRRLSGSEAATRQRAQCRRLDEVLLPEIERQQALVRKWCFEPMPRLPNRRSTKRWKNGE